jgi:hypothetical protein
VVAHEISSLWHSITAFTCGNRASRPLLLIVPLLALLAVAKDTDPSSNSPDRKRLVSALKSVEAKLGFRRTRNFQKESQKPFVAYRCYYTGKLELPDSYSGLWLAAGTKAGCPVDAEKYDVFFYPMDAAATGKTPISAGLEHEPVERFLVVVPHEDYHGNREISKLPEPLAEASATLVGFLTGMEVARQQFGENSAVYQNLQREPDLFARKAEIVNRFCSQLHDLYAATHVGQVSEHDALAKKQRAYDSLNQECAAIEPMPTSFNRCLAAGNNAGLAFDETYTRYYPIMYQLYLSKNRELRPTIDALQQALNVRTASAALDNLRKAVTSDK